MRASGSESRCAGEIAGNAVRIVRWPPNRRPGPSRRIFVVDILVGFSIEAGTHHGRRPVVPGEFTYKSAVSSGPELGQNLLALQRVAVRIMVQVLHHLGRDQRGILRRPGTRRIAQDAKLDRQPVAMRFDVGVHAPRIGLEVGAILRRGNLKRLARRHSDPQNSLLAIMLEEIRRPESRKFRRRRIAASCPSATSGPARSHIPGRRRDRRELAASMVGTPWPSRMTVTGAESPATFKLPSNWGRAERAIE